MANPFKTNTAIAAVSKGKKEQEEAEEKNKRVVERITPEEVASIRALLGQVTGPEAVQGGFSSPLLQGGGLGGQVGRVQPQQPAPGSFGGAPGSPLLTPAVREEKMRAFANMSPEQLEFMGFLADHSQEFIGVPQGQVPQRPTANLSPHAGAPPGAAGSLLQNLANRGQAQLNNPTIFKAKVK